MHKSQGENENFPKPSSKDELRAFDDEVFISGTRSVQVNLKNRGRTRSIPDLSTLRKKQKAPCKPKFFDKLLNNVRFSKKTKSTGTISSYNDDEDNSEEEDEAIVFGDEKIHCHKSIEEITLVEVDGSLLQQLEEDIKNKKIFSETLDKSKQDSDETCQNADLEKSDSVENTNSDSTKEDEVKIEQKETDNSEVKKRSSSEDSKNLTVKIFERSKSLESEPVALSTPSSPKATAGIVQDRLARFRKLTERGNRDPKTRRSSSVPSSPDLNKKDFLKGDEHFALFKKVQDRFRKNQNMSGDEPLQYGGVSVKAGYVKTLVKQLNRNKTTNGEGISVSPKSASPFNNYGSKISDIKNVNGDDVKEGVSQTPSLNNNRLESPISSTRNSLKSSDCGDTSDTTTSSGQDKTENRESENESGIVSDGISSSGQDKTENREFENESGIVSDGISSINPAKLFDESWSESDTDSLHVTDSDEDISTKQHEPVIQKDSTESKGFTESTEAPKDKIQKIVEELLNTEKAYVQRLKLLVETFQFRVDQENKVHKFLPDEIIPQMFSNVKSIYQFHNDFLLPQIVKRVGNWSSESKIGDMMKDYAPMLKMYTEYVKNFDNAMNLITVWSDKAPRFAAIMKEIQMSPECGSLTLQHHMLEPVQRIPRYEMLLKDYLKRLPEEAADRDDAQVALGLVTNAACHSNEAMKKIDSFNKLLEIVRKIDTNENLISPTRELIREGRIIKISARGGERLERFLILFNDLMLICFEPLLGSYKIRSQLEMDGMEIMERSDKCLRWILEGESIDIPNTFYVKSRQKIIQFLDENANGEPSGWCETIKQTITQYKRRKSQKGDSRKAHRNNEMTDEELGKVAPKWIKDDEVTMCMKCAVKFTALRRRHHCRACGDVVCGRCSSKKMPLHYVDDKLNRVCDDCYLLLRNDVTPTQEKNKKNKDLLHISASDPSVLSGYLHISSDKGKNWHKRWVLIHNKFAMYTFKAHQDPYALTSLALPGHIVEHVEKVEHINREHMFKISHQRSTLFLSSEAAASKKRWMYVLGKVVLAELPEDEDDTSKRDSSHSSSSNDSHENTENDHSYL